MSEQIAEKAEEKTEKIEYENVYCKCMFTKEELRDIAENLAIKTQELETKEGEKKAVMSSFKDMIETVSLDIRKGARLYKDKYEMRDVECTVERDFEKGVVTYWRTDNGEIAKQTKMTMVERQRTIDQALEDAADKSSGNSKGEEYDPHQENTNLLMAGETSAL